jgi:peptidoglycan hydrolase-like protein with peptidoglycan-binding domain
LKTIFVAIAMLAILSNGVLAQNKSVAGNGSTDKDKQVTKMRVEYQPATIEKAQQALKTRGLYKGDITGKMDPDTRDAVKAFQKQEGINPTGRLNKDTRQRLKIESSGV